LGGLGEVFSSDIGPGNTMMDAYMQKHFAPLQYDQNAKIAASGKVNGDLLNALLASPFLDQAFPKTTGPEVFNLGYLDAAIAQTGGDELSKQDIMATLCEFSAVCIVNSICSLCAQLPNVHVYTSGGGIHNPLLMKRIEALLTKGLTQVNFGTTGLLALNPDAKEAVLFALLANQTLCATDNEDSKSKANMPQVSMGKISFPD